MAENGVDEIGRVFVVDPNPIQNDIIPPEDMFIYVKFSAFPKNRVTYNGDSFVTRGVEDEVNFISTKIRYNNDGKLDPNPQQTYATTDWTNIGGFKGEDSRSSGILEGFGIKSINIKYNASLVPVVDVTFTDVRGSALFDILGNDDIKSPYAIFFKMPYPVFRLSVKGYFGQKVDYCLHMTNWNSQFDGSTGNFDISANFLGFQQAFLNDMVIGNIVGVVNTKEGYGKLNEIYNRTNSDFGLSSSGDGKSLEELQRVGKLNIRKLDDFFTRISKLKVESESLKDDLDTFKTLKFLNGKKSILKELQSFIGTPIGKEPNPTDQSNNDGTTKDYLKINNSIKQIDTSGINDNLLKLRENYFSIRDYLLINSISIGNFKNFIITLNDIVTKYNEYITDDRNQEYTNTDSLTNLSKSVGNKNIFKGKKPKLLSDIISDVTSYLNTPNDKEFIELFKISENSEDKWKDFVIDSQKPNGKLIDDQRFSLRNVLSKMTIPTDELYLKNNYVGGNDVNNNFDINNFNNVVVQNTYYNNNMLRDTVVVVADFREIREKLQNEIESLESIIKSQQQIVQEDLNEKLFNKSNDSENEFKPTIKTCFEVLANNTQAMVETIYEITKSSENLGSQRNSLINSQQTDIPQSILKSLSSQNKSIAWPSFYAGNGNESQKEIYIGDVSGVNRNNFPEYDFVERVFDNFISKREELQQITKTSTLNNGTDTDNWFPINPMDYDVNPFLKLRFLNTESEIIEYFTEQMLTRIALLENYSLFDTTTGGLFEDYAKFDAINAFETVKVNNQTVLLIKNIIDRIKNDGDKLGTNSLIGKTNFFKNNVVKGGVVITYSLKESDGVQPKIGDIPFGLNYDNPNIDYILFDNKEIINNSSKLWNSIKESNEYKKFFPDVKSKFTKKGENGDLIYETKYVSSNNLYTNNIYNVWDISIGKNLLKSSNTESENIITKFGDVKLEDIDVKSSTGDTTGIYLNKTYFTDDTENNYEETFTGNDFYIQQTFEGKGYLLLSTIPYRDFKKGFINSLFPNDKFVGARIVKLPKLYVYYLGSLLWRYNENTDPLDWTDYTNFQTSKNNYPTKISYYKSISSEEKPLEDELINLPISVKNTLINKFKDWVTFNFNSEQTGNFESEFNNYVSDTPNDIDQTKSYLLKELINTTELIILNPDIFVRKKNKLLIGTSRIELYINKFSELFSKKSNDNSDTSGNNVEEEKQKVSEKNKKEIKLQIYNYFKNINDKWVAGSEEGKSFNVCGVSGNDLIKYFRFIDRGWSDIGDQATINLNSFLSLGNNQDTSVYFFMSKLLRDSNFLFQILPSYIDYKDENEVAKMFRPFTTLESPNSSGPVYCCIYVGGASQVLDIKETNNYYFNNDGYSFKNGEIPSDMGTTNNAIDAKDEFKLVAFRVAFGAQNQTIFKNVSLNQQEHKETGEYFSLLTELIDKRGGTQKVYQGTDLLRLFKTRSYTCQVDALGCMNIQPLMYFDLQNVPFFNGAYLITSVSHSITLNHMTTNFQGVRQSKYITPPTTSITADIDIDLDATNEIPKIEFSNLNNTNQIYSIGVNSEVAELPFDVSQISIGTLNKLGVPTTVTDNLNNDDIEFIKTTINGSTNSDVAMFFANALVNSNNFLNSEFKWDNGEFSENVVKFPSNFIDFSGKTKAYQLSNVEIFPSDNKYFTYTPTTTATTTSSENQETAYYFPKTPPSLIEYDKVVDPESVLEIKLDNLDKLKYYNIFKGDEYMYRPVGFLYMIGRKQYFDLFGSDAINSPQSYCRPPFQRSFEIAYKVWENIKVVNGKSGSEYAKNKVSGRLGSFTSFNQSRLASQQFEDKGIENSAKVFQKVLQIFKYETEPLIDLFNP